MGLQIRLSHFSKTVLAALFIIFFTPIHSQKINGINFVGTRKSVSHTDFEPIVELGATHACFIPFAYTRDGQAGLAYKDLEWQWKGESLEGIRECIKIAKQQNLQSMIKPQVWIGHGSFTGDFELHTEEEWLSFENDYRGYIMSFAHLAEEEQVAIFCVGTELCSFVNHRPAFWRDLISEIRTVYHGKLTYASNWDSFQRFPHWELLDFIGIDAYFPICDQSTPKLKTLLIGWQAHYEEMKTLSEAKSKPILFTEYGYRSVDHCAREPWISDRGGNVNTIAQYNAYLALFRRFWNQEWFAGGLLWKWFPNHNVVGGVEDNRFTPQNKPAEDLIKEWYRKS